MIATLHYRARFARGRKYSGGQGQDFEAPGAFNAPAAATRRVGLVAVLALEALLLGTRRAR
jgi:hypothetical protein